MATRTGSRGATTRRKTPSRPKPKAKAKAKAKIVVAKTRKAVAASAASAATAVTATKRTISAKGKKNIKRAAAAVVGAAAAAAVGAVVKKVAKKVAARKTAKKAQAVARKAAAPKTGRKRVETDIPLEKIEGAYTPTQTSLKAPFRATGADRQRDQEYARGVADDRWRDEDVYTNKSGDPRIGTHGRTYEPREKSGGSRSDENR